MKNINTIIAKSFEEGLGTQKGDAGILTKTAATTYNTVMKPATTARNFIEKAKQKLRKL